ncbi:hypothetical protein [Paenibacillus marinisediminis]
MNNKKLIEASKRISDKSYKLAMKQAYQATHPSQERLHKGALISGGVGIILIIAGGVSLLFSTEGWVWGLICSGLILIMINAINMILNKKK